MTFIVVTRLRIRDSSFLDDFFAAAVAVVEQAQSSEGNVAADVLGEAHSTYWTRTGWDDEAAMRRFMMAEPHRSTMVRIDEWCDEATFVNWHQSEVSLPEWDAAYERLITNGTVVDLPHASVTTLSARFRLRQSRSSPWRAQLSRQLRE